MMSSFRIAAILATLVALPVAAAARCQTGPASAPYIGAADMRAIDAAAARLPRAKGGMRASIGAPVPAGVKRAPVPGAIARVLPQYKGYRAFRLGRQLAIADREGVLSYLMPLGGSGKPGNCP